MEKTWGDFKVALQSGAPIREFLPTYLANTGTHATDAETNDPLPASKANNMDGKQAINSLYENVGVLGDDILRLHCARADVSSFILTNRTRTFCLFPHPQNAQRFRIYLLQTKRNHHNHL